MADKTAYHPDGIRTIEFLERYHTYTDDTGKRYTSGTTFVKPFFPKFDAVAVSTKCSEGDNPLYAGRDPQEIRAEWLAEGRRGSSEGDNAHAYAEALISGWPVKQHPKPISLRCAFLFWQVRRAVRWLTEIKGFVFISAETIVFSPELGIAGMIDLLLYDPSTNEIIITDWKQNKEITRTNQWQKGLPPIDHLQVCNIAQYSLQLSLYQYLLTRENYFPSVSGFRRALIHIRPTSFTPIPLEYYDYEIKSMLSAA